MAKIRVAAIQRQYCSGGREIAKLAAKRLGISCYDKELAELTAAKLGVTYEEIAKYEETLVSPLFSPVTFRSGIDRKQNMSEERALHNRRQMRGLHTQKQRACAERFRVFKSGEPYAARYGVPRYFLRGRTLAAAQDG